MISSAYDSRDGAARSYGTPDGTLAGLSPLISRSLANMGRVFMTHIYTGRFARSVLHFSLLCATVTSVLAASTTSPQLLLQGRFGDVNGLQTAKSLPVLFSWPSSSVFLTFQSSSINITLTALQSTVQYSSYNRFTFWLDSKLVAIQTSDPNNTSINWSATGLSSATHNLTITKLNEATYGEATLDSIVLGTNGK